MSDDAAVGVRELLTAARDQQATLDWLARTFGNVGPIRRARRYQRNVVEELEDLVELLA